MKTPSSFKLSRRNVLKKLVIGSAVFTVPAIVAQEREVGSHYKKKIDYQGIHQAGVITKEQKNVSFISCNVTAMTLAELKMLFKVLTGRIAYLTQSNNLLVNDNDKMPPFESGMLGGHLDPDSLTVTVSLGANLFDSRFGLQQLKPRHLVEMKSFPNDQLDPNWCGGDIGLQICANSPESVVYALRDILQHTSMYIVPRWKMDGFLPSRDIDNKTTPVNLFGFKDGTGNAPANNTDLMDDLVWVTAKDKEPHWCIGGSYQAVRLIRFNLEFWDRTPLEDQENDFGRHKITGAPIGMKHEHDSPEYETDPHGDRILFNSHMRRAEPRNPERYTAKLRRRSYSYSLGINNFGMLDMGLIFICYQKNLQKGFIDTQKRLNGEPLERYIKPFGGSYYFVLPGVKANDDYLGQALFNDV
ncbi:deferrochelatase/peroxidase EfeB [Photobacterium phosphoreum]|uniref:Deferrochelatase n=1 Tax=Photobacterium phosphoreum TaxID=659 RepID=A0A2T3JTN1_PHOPO|nr:iron uptake transporter deferrochelatase/peroxidase subunit [Photobacterium phosphoreum]PSU25876.1 deferrochelatase/peroxidase EfeB [Photobacterium phosphoreum]PSU43216.1 deferrochelatase/peroxidase EfeB [Photobacterium phosphoreum]PSU52519.1 deferrochelatase/peroxidase EfeB [Photobacterium phosphoreum]